MLKAFAITAIALLGSTAFAAGEVYRWKDANGIWHFSDQPQPGAELVRNTGRPQAPPTRPVEQVSPSPSTLPTYTNEAPALSSETVQQVRQEAAVAKAQQCEKAKVAYANAVQARRITRTDDKGNKVFLNDAEIDAARLEARSARDLACGP